MCVAKMFLMEADLGLPRRGGTVRTSIPSWVLVRRDGVTEEVMDPSKALELAEVELEERSGGGVVLALRQRECLPGH